MKQISGTVLVKETNSGIPNLVVTAYDSEKSMQEIVGGHADIQPLSLRDVRQAVVAYVAI